MTTFTIDTDYNITALATGEQPAENAADFDSQKGLEQILTARKTSGTSLVELWNSLPGVVPVKKFTNSKAAVARIWKQIQTLAPQAAPVATVETPTKAKSTGSKKAPKAAKAAKKAKAEKPAKKTKVAPREGSKLDLVVGLMKRKAGATLPEIMVATGWQKHSVRGFVAGTLVKKGYSVESTKPEGGERTYKITA